MQAKQRIRKRNPAGAVFARLPRNCVKINDSQRFRICWCGSQDKLVARSSRVNRIALMPYSVARQDIEHGRVHVDM